MDAPYQQPWSRHAGEEMQTCKTAGRQGGAFAGADVPLFAASCRKTRLTAVGAIRSRGRSSPGLVRVLEGPSVPSAFYLQYTRSSCCLLRAGPTYPPLSLLHCSRSDDLASYPSVPRVVFFPKVPHAAAFLTFVRRSITRTLSPATIHFALLEPARHLVRVCRSTLSPR